MLPRTRLFGEFNDHCAAAARRQFLEIGFNRRGIVKAIQALAVGTQLADRLRAAQHQHRQQAPPAAGTPYTLAKFCA
jgi:hypothetical protein